MDTKTCSECNGSGYIVATCPGCHGRPAQTDNGCSKCDDEGYIEVRCRECGGSGEIEVH